MQYRRVRSEGGCYFFTLVTFERSPLFKDPSTVRLFREVCEWVQERRPFDCEADVILPDHLPMQWRLPEGDSDYSTRIRLIKHGVTRGLTSRGDQLAMSRPRKQQRAVWQPRFWEHLIRDEADWRNHIDYIHFNPVKHGLVESPAERAESSFHRFVEEGLYPPEWGRVEPDNIKGMVIE